MTPLINEVSPKPSHSIGYLVDTANPQKERNLGVLRRSFGEQYAVVEDIEAPRYLYLDLRPGGALEKSR